MFWGELQEVASLVFARRRRKKFERTLIFLHSPPKLKEIYVFGGSKWCNIYRFFIQPAAGENIFVFWVGSKWGNIYLFFTQHVGEKTFVFFLVKMVPHFWNLMFSGKTKKKKTIASGGITIDIPLNRRGAENLNIKESLKKQISLQIPP